MTRSAFRTPTLCTLALCACLMIAMLAVAATPVAAAPVEASDAPTLSVERTSRAQTQPQTQAQRIYVEFTTPDGRSERAFLRQTQAPVTPGAAGWDAARDTGFVNWTEDGARWTAFTQNGGLTWSEARAIRSDLALTAGTVRPGEPMPATDGLELRPDGRVYVVQFASLSLPAWRDALSARGIEVLQPLPHNAHLVRLDPTAAAALERLNFVERVEPYHPAYRLQDELRSWLLTEASDKNGPEEQRVRVMAFEWGPEGKNRIVASARGLGGRVAAFWPSGHVVELWLNRGQMQALAQHDDVMWMDLWTPAENDMDVVREDAGTNWYESTSGICGQGVRGEVMDSGLQDTHPDFAGRTLFHGGFDLSSHGTSTYGIVFGEGIGNASAIGHMPCNEQGIFADYGFMTDRFAHTQELKSPPYEAAFQSNSWGNTRTLSYTSVSAEMDDIIWRLDIAITQSQSNAGTQQSRPQAWAKNIISVGGVYHYGTLDPNDDAWNFGASIGPAADGRIKPDLNYWYDGILTTTTGSGYTNFGGTSAATPEVAGVLGLMARQWADNLWNTNPTGSTVFDKLPHATTLKALLINNSQQYSFSGTGDDLTRVHQGWGRPNLEIANDRAAHSFIVDESDVLTVGQTASYSVNVPAGESELKVTMVYNDPPGSPSASIHRVNDLSLRVTAPGGAVYHGNNGLLANNYSTAGGSPNTLDTVENVFVQNPAAGSWTIEVTAAEINQDAYLATTGTDDANFALVVTGASAGAPAVCGDGVKEGGEQCDGLDLGGATCGDFGCSTGSLSCNVDCTLDTSACTSCTNCGNGICEAGEDCSTCPSDCGSGGATCGNGICETADGENCQTCAADCAGQQSGNPNNRFCCGLDTACSDNRCSSGGLTCTTGSSASCCGDGICSGLESACSCDLDCGGPTVEGAGIGNSCADGIDNDCDGDIDCNDIACLSDAACSCSASGAACSSNSQCCSGNCKGNGVCK